MIIKVCRIIIITLICAAVFSFHSVQAVGASREYLIKAAYLLNFAKFVKWPEAVFPNNHTPLIICILGNDPFEDAIKTIQGKKVQGRDLVIKYSSKIENIKQVHILFVSRSEKKNLQQIFSVIRGKNILTVSDIEKFAERGGIINFYTEKTMVRLQVNLKSTKAADLQISSKLLRIAEIIKK